ncbi:hypothetical protein MOV10_14405 [Salmonella enterica subsp. enterica serovar Abeokuta]|uniref:Uncharacterized protein n=1 Tax=Salmonella enterica subsp. enterica serovar Abeokuta TaxID=2926665 RepID=A0A8T9IE52_SALET|nr:hypothetical protein [Salmonella enterica]EDW9823521.1 hypothetical protein [Salmonella enterica]EKC9954119.1 hypothetical protein [Salmonella enterica]ELC7118642.1 hypothetical protein [Salmonella enterica]UNO32329.1 hypothetical protein MOV10_14405 [Salmonella enterica subsp. enterica serovar Abeokuta]
MTNNQISDEQLDNMIASAVNSAGPFPDKRFALLIDALRELRELRQAPIAEPISFDALNAAVAEVTGCNQHSWNAAIYKGHHPVPSMNYNSLARIVDMYRSPQPTPAISCPKPVVKLPTTRCWAGISNFYYAADVIAAIRAAGVEVSND